MEGPERHGSQTLRREGCHRQEALRGGEGEIQCMSRYGPLMFIDLVMLTPLQEQQAAEAEEDEESS